MVCGGLMQLIAHGPYGGYLINGDYSKYYKVDECIREIKKAVPRCKK